MTNTLDENYKYSFDLVNEWLRFAEAKIATALALNGVGIAAITTLIVSESFFEIYAPLRLWILLVLCVFLVSVVLCLIALSPIIKNVSCFDGSGIKNVDKNIFFFASTANMTVNEFIDASNADVNKLLAYQIIVNSKIAKRKFRWFNAVAYVDLVGLVPPFCIWLIILGIKKLVLKARLR